MFVSSPYVLDTIELNVSQVSYFVFGFFVIVLFGLTVYKIDTVVERCDDDSIVTSIYNIAKPLFVVVLILLLVGYESVSKRYNKYSRWKSSINSLEKIVKCQKK
ncbi:hypothetical protein [Bacteriovorax sp. DB6_IX]|uniref:hypothetical protein n=1 Tax=Bacteriovorax sp. DB6_IX TaxID=1353530 RepID=UPI0004115940|nr:hypothetical protein [Bacteriovorax sp. DB6_IX]